MDLSFDLLVASLFFVQFLATNAIIIDTKLGQIEGIKDEYGMYLFRNLPYAEPPLMNLRWRPPKPFMHKFQGIFNATVAGNACVQPSINAPNFIRGSNGILSEDCLTLGIQTPYQFDKSESQSLRKVFFWIHGGGLESGTGYNGYFGSLAKSQNIVVVAINYRLGIGGFLPDPQLYKSSTGNGGAIGFLDIIEALKWTKENIESFGGDPNEITIGGESGGGWAVCGLILSPLAKDLFKRSIQLSGTCIESSGKILSQNEAWQMSQEIKQINNVTRFDELRIMDLQTITDTFFIYGNGQSLLPSIDGYVFPLTTLELMQHGHVNGESLMLGTLFRESFNEKPWNVAISPQNLDELNEYYYKKLFDTEAQLIQEYYPENEVYTKIWPYGKSEFENNVASLIKTVQTTDCWVKCGTIWQSDIIASNPITTNSFPVYLYQYGYIKQPYDRISHGYDLLGLFGRDIAWLNGGIKYSDKLVQQTQKFFGDYINGGIVPMKNGKPASVQNGLYIQIVEKIKIVDVEDLNNIKSRCQVYKLLGDEIWRNKFCVGIYLEDITPPQIANTTDNQCSEDSSCST
mmetsp:Transcript_67830/g.60966  ORF Transcript_67830/g.60966 Transcript_67830/m.60966 type:complete len:573 (-) Transcript_67830:125-1843(-)